MMFTSRLSVKKLERRIYSPMLVLSLGNSCYCYKVPLVSANQSIAVILREF
jgi:hypothetical protein